MAGSLEGAGKTDRPTHKQNYRTLQSLKAKYSSLFVSDLSFTHPGILSLRLTWEYQREHCDNSPRRPYAQWLMADIPVSGDKEFKARGSVLLQA